MILTQPPAIILDQVRTAIVASAAWQAWCGSPEQATAQTYLVTAPEDAGNPHCIIDLAEDLTGLRDGAAPGRFTLSGSVLIYFNAADGSSAEGEAILGFIERVFSVVADLELKPVAAGGFVLRRWTKANGPTRTRRLVRGTHKDELELLLSAEIGRWP